MDGVTTRLCGRLTAMRDTTIPANPYCRTLLQAIQAATTTPPKQIVCYGLGPVCRSIVSQHQLAVLSWLGGSMGVPIYCYDPCFDQDDLLVLRHFGIALCEYPRFPNAPLHTLLFMPHCEGSVYSGVLSLAGACDSVCVFGNRLSMYDEFRTDEAMRIVRLDDGGYIRTDVFNDCHLHTWRREDAMR